MTHAPTPRPVDSLVGREQDVAALCALLLRPDVRLLNLTGPGGVGKTRLAIAVADRVGANFEGVGYVRLAAIREPDLVLPTIAQAVAPREADAHLPAERLRTVLAERRVLLILDNFEQILAASPRIAKLLAEHVGLKVLVTSRAVLRISGERTFPVPPLGLPLGPSTSPEDALTAPAVRLFVDRAEAADSTFAVNSRTVAAVVETCRRLDGLPLAIELAAARLRHLAPEALLTRLEQRLPLLTGGPRDQPQRLQTMRDAIAWSYGLLDSAEQALYRQLSVFVGGFTLEAAECISFSPNPPSPQSPSSLDLLASLCDQSLLRRADGPGVMPRFDMLETIHEYAEAQLTAQGETEDARRRHAEYFLMLAETAQPALTGPEQDQWHDLLDADHDNLRATLRWAIHTAQGATACRLVAALWRFWQARGHWSEGRSWLAQALATAGDVPPAVRAEALLGAGALAFPQGDNEQATSLLEQALALFRTLDDQRGLGDALTNLGLAASHRADHATAAVYQEEALATFRLAGNREGMADALHNLGNVFFDQQQFDRSVELWQASLDLEREMGRQHGLAASLLNLGIVAHDLGDDVQSVKLLEEALQLLRELEMKEGVAWCLEGLAILATPLRPASATRMLGLADTLEKEIGAYAPAHRQQTFNRIVATLRETLGEAAFAVAWADGQTMSLEDAQVETRALAAALTGPVPFVRTRPAAHGLTGREMEILALVAKGHSNQEIGQLLSISRATVARHVANIFNKLGADSRAQAIAFAHRHGLA